MTTPPSATQATAPASPPALTWLLATAALIGFAANSLLCRAALAGDAIDPWSFTALRLISGAIMLAPMLVVLRPPVTGRAAAVPARWKPLAGAALLSLYAAAFSLAYVRLETGMGALILFASVNITMIGVALGRGARPALLAWIGAAIALAGLVVLTAPGGARPPSPGAAALMALAGAAWGGYTLLGRGVTDPIRATARNFAWAVPLAVGLGVVALATPVTPGSPSLAGIALAVASGAFASGLGYAAWYAAVPRLPAIAAATVQLTAPVLAALAAVFLLQEPLTVRVILGGALIVLGVAATLRSGGR